MKPVRPFPLSARILIGLWAGIVFFGGIAYAQEKNIDTLHIFKADTVRLGFDNVLPLSAIYDSADKEDWHYIYRWNTGERSDNISVKFNGKRKVLYIVQRLSAIHWPEEYETFPVTAPPYYRHIDPKEDTCIVCAPKMDADTVIYEWWHDLFYKEKYPDTERCIKAYKGKGSLNGTLNGTPQHINAFFFAKQHA